jgi:hypothetical protein
MLPTVRALESKQETFEKGDFILLTPRNKYQRKLDDRNTRRPGILTYTPAADMTIENFIQIARIEKAIKSCWRKMHSVAEVATPVITIFVNYVTNY